MADITTILVAGFGAVGTVTSGLGGYWISGRIGGCNEAARDNRAAQRDQMNRAADLAERQQEQRHDWQREVLLELQDELQRLARATGRVLLQDNKTIREHGGVFVLGDEIGGDDALAATVAVQKVRSRVLDNELRSQIGDFLAFCSYATTGAVADHKHDPADQLAVLINGLLDELGTQYDALVNRLGEHIRRELGRE